jgi:hypothetical protein
MEKWRMAILYDQRLPGESLAHILEKELLLDISLVAVNDPDMINKLGSSLPNLLMIVEEEDPNEQASLLFAKILDDFPSLPLIRIKLSQQILQIYTTHTIPARSPDLLEAIQRTLAAYSGESELPINS